MIQFLFLTAIALLFLPGLLLWRLELVRKLDLPARLAVAFAGGLLLVSLLMFGCTLIGVQWSRANLGIALLACTIAGVAAIRGSGSGRGRQRWVVWLPVLTIVAILVYAAGNARITCADLIYFWGSKGVHFDQARRINAELLRYSDYYLLHPDYPPLVPLVYAWGALVARRLSWWGALLLTPLLLLATAAAFRGLARRDLGDERANLYTILLTALLGCCYAVTVMAGGADPTLLLFETLALTTLTFARPGERGALVLAAVALAGCVFTKVEGAAFAVTVILAFLITRRALRAALLTLLPPLLLLGSWIWWVKRERLLDSYGNRNPLHLDFLPAALSLVVLQVRYSSFYLPWVAALGPLVFVRNWRRAALPLLTGIGVIAYTLFFYLHAPVAGDLWFWIASSAERVLLTALMCFVVATAAGSE